MRDLEKIFTKICEDAVKIFEDLSGILKGSLSDFEKIFEDAVKIFEASLRSLRTIY